MRAVIRPYRLALSIALGGWMLVAAPAGAQGPSEEPKTESVAPFDGTWSVTVDCPTHGGSAGYTLQFLGEVKDGALKAQHGPVGKPGSLTLAGKIQPDGRAVLSGRGRIGDPTDLGEPAPRGIAYVYRATGRFEGTRGMASRVGARPCTLTFVKQ